jgi:uncharacterized protein YwgA
MTRLQLAKLVQWAGTFQSRKRMQKVCFLLQANGCPLELDFYLDSIGPYSQDLAQLTDEMRVRGLLEEEAEGSEFHQRFNYRLAQKAKKQLAEIEESGTPPDLTQLALFELQFRQLLEKDVQDLQHAAILVYLLLHGKEKLQAVEQICTRYGWAEFPESVLAIADQIMVRTVGAH